MSSSSSNTTLVPDGQHRVRRQRREPHGHDHAGGAIRSGTATITLTVADGSGGTASDTFVLTVTAVNDLPTISDITDKTTAAEYGQRAAHLHGRRRGNGRGRR